MACDTDRVFPQHLAATTATAPQQSAIALSVVAPFFNERDCAARFLEEVTGCLAALGRSYELICVDDASSDGTANLLLELASRLPT